MQHNVSRLAETAVAAARSRRGSAKQLHQKHFMTKGPFTHTLRYALLSVVAHSGSSNSCAMQPAAQLRGVCVNATDTISRAATHRTVQRSNAPTYV